MPKTLGSNFSITILHRDCVTTYILFVMRNTKMSVFRKLNKSKLHLLQRICLPSANKASQEKNVRIFLILVFIYEKYENMGVSILRKTLLE